MRATFLFGFLLLSTAAYGDPALPASAARGLKICVSANAPAAIKEEANRLLSAVATQPLLVVLAGTAHPAKLVESEALMNGPVEARAFDHLVVIGLPGDPLIQAAWQHEARLTDKGMYIFGFGNFKGNIGYVESDRNPFLHSAAIRMTPYETELVTLTGSTPDGVRQAVNAFLTQGLLNGVVAAPGWTRGEPTLLDRDPLPSGFTAPAVPRKLGQGVLVGVSAVNESVYRGTLEAGGAEPRQIWQYKYYVPGAWDEAGMMHTITQFWAGLHRAAFDNALWVAQFANPTQASEAMHQIATGVHWEQKGAEWVGPSISLGTGDKVTSISKPPHLWARDAFVYISTLPGLDPATVSGR